MYHALNFLTVTALLIRTAVWLAALLLGDGVLDFLAGPQINGQAAHRLFVYWTPPIMLRRGYNKVLCASRFH